MQYIIGDLYDLIHETCRTNFFCRFVLIGLEVFSPLMFWLVCAQIWDMTQVVGSSVAAGFSPRWLAVSEGTAHTPLTDIMKTLTYLSNSLVLQLWSLRKTDTSTRSMWICVSLGCSLILWTRRSCLLWGVMTWIWVNMNSRYFWKHNICALSVCVRVALSQAEGFWYFVLIVFPLSRSTTQTQEVFLHHILFLLHPSFLVIFSPVFKFECYYWS